MTFKMIITSRPFPSKVTYEGKKLTVITFDCVSETLTMPGKRKPLVKLKFKVYSLSGWTMFKINNLYQGKHIILKGVEAKELNEHGFWASDIEEVNFNPTKEELFEFEEREF